MCAWLAGNVRYHDLVQGVITLQLWWICLRGCKETIHSEKKVLSRTNKGYSAVPIGEPFEEPFLVSSRTSLGSVPDRVLPGTKNGSPMGTAKEPVWNPFSRGPHRKYSSGHTLAHIHAHSHEDTHKFHHKFHTYCGFTNPSLICIKEKLREREREREWERERESMRERGREIGSWVWVNCVLGISMSNLL
jgi:hypothetical protein